MTAEWANNILHMLTGKIRGFGTELNAEARGVAKMDEDRLGRISLGKAVRRVGAAIFATEWIGDLTHHEKHLIETYKEGRNKPPSESFFPSSIESGRISYIDGTGRDYDLLPFGSPIWDEVDRAVVRREFQRTQYREADRWLTKRGFDCRADTLDAVEFERAFSEAFGMRDHGQAKSMEPRQKSPVPHAKLRAFFQAIKEQGGPRPAADTDLLPRASAAFPTHLVTRHDARATSKAVWGEQPPGRPRTSAE